MIHTLFFGFSLLFSLLAAVHSFSLLLSLCVCFFTLCTLIFILEYGISSLWNSCCLVRMYEDDD